MSALLSFPDSPSLLPGRSAPSHIQIVDGVMTIDRPLSLESGRMMEDATIAYRILGASQAPVVVVLGGISADRRFKSDSAEDSTGWWQDQFGAGLPGDTQRFRFLSIDYLGACGGTTGPGNWNDAASRFPCIDSADQAQVIRILLDHLEITRLHSFIGASYGGMVALQFAARHPERLLRALVLCAAHEPWPMASGLRHVQRQVLDLGIECGHVDRAMQIARALAMCTYRSEREFSRRFRPNGSGRLNAAAYLDHCGQAFAERFNVHAYRILSRSIDDHRVDPSSISVPIDLVGFSTDQIVPPKQLIDLRKKLSNAGALRILESIYGHDAFLKETGKVGRLIRAHLEDRS